MTQSKFDQIKKAFIEEVFGHVELESYANLEHNEPTDHVHELKVSASLPPPMSSPVPVAEEHASLVGMLQLAKESLSLGAFIRQQAHHCDLVTYRTALFEQAQISRDYWSRLLNDEVRASKEKLLRVAILLKLSSEDAKAMLEKAGYTLSPTIMRDVVVDFCLRQGHYDFVVIEQLLADHEIQSLFNDRVVR